MNQPYEDELNPKERQAFESLARETTPPAVLEERVVAALKASNLIRSPKSGPWLSFPGIAIATAASVVLLSLGVVIGAWWAAPPSPDTNMDQFILLLRASPLDSQTVNEAEILEQVREYAAWARTVRQTGHLLEGEKLKQEIQTLRAVNGRTDVSEEYPDKSGTMVEGYFVIQAHDYEEALRIAEGCPHLKYGGKIELRQIDRF